MPLPLLEWCQRRCPVPSDRQRMSYDVSLEVRGEIIRTVLCNVVIMAVIIIPVIVIMLLLWSVVSRIHPVQHIIKAYTCRFS